MTSVDINGEMFLCPSKDSVRAIIRLLKRLADSVVSDENVCAR